MALTQPVANWLPQIAMLSWLPHVGLENAYCNWCCPVLEFTVFWEPSDVEVAADWNKNDWNKNDLFWLDSDWNKNDFQVAWDLKKAPRLNRRYWHLCSSCTAVSSMLWGGSTMWLCWTVILCFLLCSRPILEWCLTFLWLINAQPSGRMDGWIIPDMSWQYLLICSSTALLLSLTMIICVIFQISNKPPFFLQITYYGKGFHHLQIRYANHQTIIVSRNSHKNDKYLYLMKEN